MNLRPSMFDTFAKLSDGRHNMQNNNLKAGGVLDFSYKIFLIEDIFLLSASVHQSYFSSNIVTQFFKRIEAHLCLLIYFLVTNKQVMRTKAQS